MSTQKSRRGKRPQPRRPAATPQTALAQTAPAAPRRRLPDLNSLLDRFPALDSLLMRIPSVARRRAGRITRKDILAAVPFRNPLIDWEIREAGAASREGPEVLLRVPRRQDRWGKILNRLFEGPPYRQVVLDELGTDVWQMCDGETSVEALIRALAKKHKLERREVEISLTMYLRTLARRGFIGLRVGQIGEKTE